MMDDAGWIDRFIRHLEFERRLSPLTCKNYRRDLEALAAYCDTADVANWTDVDSEYMRSFSAACYRKGLSAKSIQRRLSAARTFFRYLIREKAIKSNPVASVSAPKAKKRLPGNLDADRMARLLQIEDLNLGDVDMQDATVRVTGKGNKDRIVPVGRCALQALRQWAITRGDLAGAGEKALFVSNRGARISPRSVQARVKHWAKQQGIDANVYPHLFRHSFATHVLESSHDLRGVQELLGHANIATTQVYTHLDFQHLAQIYDQTHPRARKNKG
jgi:integrase/recombinase XerC